MIDIEEVRRLVADFDPGDNDADIESRTKTIGLLDDKSDPFDRRDYDPGHITASAVVLSPDLESVVLVNHPRVGLWIQPGGHVEPRDSTLAGAAGREVHEETGLTVVADATAPLVRVDVHEIPPTGDEPLHWHYDLTLSLVCTDRRSDARGDSEWTWCGVNQLEARGIEPALRRSIRRAQALRV